MNQALPSVGSRYTQADGQSFEVIGHGTHGIVVEYISGLAEVIDSQKWQSLKLSEVPLGHHARN